MKIPDFGQSQNALVIVTLSTEKYVATVQTVASTWTLKLLQVELVKMLVVGLCKKSGLDVERNASQWLINTTLIFLVSTRMKMQCFWRPFNSLI